MIATVGLGAQAEAHAPCPELVRLRNAASEISRQAMSAAPSERCRALHQASLAAEATLDYATSNRASCPISDQSLDQLEGYYRKAAQARDNCRSGRPLRPFPPEIIQR